METLNIPKVFVLDGLAVAELLSPGCKVDPYFLPEEEKIEQVAKAETNTKD